MALAKETTLEPTDNLAPEARADFGRIAATSTCEPPVHAYESVDARPTGDDVRLVFAQKHDYLRGVLRGYVSRFRLAEGAEVDEVALEVLAETFEQALLGLHRFDPALSPSGTLLPWLQGIAANIVKNRVRQKSRIKETSLSQLANAQAGEAPGEAEAFDSIVGLTDQGTAIGARLEAQAGLDEMLSLVSPDDAQVLRLVFEEELDGEAIARRLSISHDAARQRQHRALSRLKSKVTQRGEPTRSERPNFGPAIGAR